MTDEQLLADHVASIPGAFTELVRRHRNRLWSLALSITGQAADAEDALQVGLLKAARSAEYFQGQSQVYTWLHRIVTNAALDVVRARARRLTVESAAPTATTVSAAASAPTADFELRATVRAALNTLDADRRAAIVLVDMFGYSVAESAVILGVPVGTIKSRCARGRAQLAELLRGVTP